MVGRVPHVQQVCGLQILHTPMVIQRWMTKVSVYSTVRLEPSFQKGVETNDKGYQTL